MNRVMGVLSTAPAVLATIVVIGIVGLVTAAVFWRRLRVLPAVRGQLRLAPLGHPVMVIGVVGDHDDSVLVALESSSAGTRVIVVKPGMSDDAIQRLEAWRAARARLVIREHLTHDRVTLSPRHRRAGITLEVARG